MRRHRSPSRSGAAGPRLVLLGLVLLGAAACGRMPARDSRPGTGTPDGSEAQAIVNDVRFHEALRTAVRDYSAFGEVDDVMRWVPGLCTIPRLDIHSSRSTDAATHGDKLFWLFAKDRDAYLEAGTRDQPVGQILVKEAWASRKATVEDLARLQPDEDGHLFSGDDPRFRSISFQTIERDGTHYTADHVKGLYVMLRLAADTAGTDAGWVYGTLAPDGETVTSAGRVASCMGCHGEARRDRMFGLHAE
jgi:hypothetical protein